MQNHIDIEVGTSPSIFRIMGFAKTDSYIFIHIFGHVILKWPSSIRQVTRLMQVNTTIQKSGGKNIFYIYLKKKLSSNKFCSFELSIQSKKPDIFSFTILLSQNIKQ